MKREFMSDDVEGADQIPSDCRPVDPARALLEFVSYWMTNQNRSATGSNRLSSNE
jgi:hypothetical protein